MTLNIYWKQVPVPLATVVFMLLVAAGCSSGGGGGDTQATPDYQSDGVDLIPYARLNAEPTRVYDEVVWSHLPVPWPAEATDAIATIRDDNPATGWKAPLGVEAEIEIDLAPEFGADTPLYRLEMDGINAMSADVTVSLLTGCGGSALKTFVWADPGSPLVLKGQRAGCVVIHVRSDIALDVRQIGLYGAADIPQSRDVQGGLADHPGSGVVEGFYGVPWSWRERTDLLRTLARAGLDTYIYAPKWDPLHRQLWRESYDDKFMQHFSELSAYGRSLGVTVYFGLAPFADYNYADEADYLQLLSKITGFLNRGTDGLALLSDDIELISNTPLDRDLGAKQAALITRLYADLRATQPALKLVFVPGVYSAVQANRLPEGWAYLAALSAIPESVHIMWTGNDVFNAGISRDDLVDVTAAIGRPPLLWDNFYANDGADLLIGRIYLSPYTNVSADISASVAGVVLNPMIQGGLSRWVAGTLGNALCDGGQAVCGGPAGKAAASETALSSGAIVNPAREIELLKSIGRLFTGNGSIPEVVDRNLNAAIADLADEMQGAGLPSPATMETLLYEFARAPGLYSELHHSGLNADLVDELIYPLRKAAALGRAGLAELILLELKLQGSPSADQLAIVAALRDALRQYRFELSEGAIDELGAISAAAGPARESILIPPLATADLPACQSGVQIQWRPFSGNPEVRVYGLPGATVTADAVRWVPPVSGRYRGVVTAQTRAGVNTSFGWNYREFELICE